MELWEVYDSERRKTGRIIDRDSNEKLSDKEYHISSEVIIINQEGDILISRRSSKKHKFPLMWEFTGGACKKGENSLQTALRETKEELGITLKKEKAVFYKTVRNDDYRYFKDIWLFNMNVELKNINFIDGEVIDVNWVDINKFKKMYNNKLIVPTIKFTDKEYIKCKKLLNIE